MIFFFFNDTAPTEIYTLSLHDALPISATALVEEVGDEARGHRRVARLADADERARHQQLLEALRSEEHTSELQSRQYLVCRLLLEKKKTFPSAFTVSLLFCHTPTHAIC